MEHYRISNAKRILVSLFVAVCLTLVYALPVYGDYFAGQIASAYLSLSSSGTPNSDLLIGTSTTTNSYLSLGGTAGALATAPSINATAATSITMTSARLNSIILFDGSDDCEVRFGFDTATHAVFTDYTHITTWVNSYRTASVPYLDVTGLIIGTPYFYRAQVRNSDSTVTSTPEITFTTIATIGNTLGLIATPAQTSILLTWQKASGSTNTIIRYRTDTYPTTIADGLSAYSGTGFQVTLSGLTAGQVYYFSAWGYANPSSPTQSQLAMSTLGVNVPGTSGATLPTPVLPANMNTPPSTTGFQLEPFTSIIAYFTNSGLGMPVPNVWMVIAIIVIVIVGLGTYIKVKNFFVAFYVVFALTVVFAGLHLVQWWLAPLEIVTGMAVWAIDRYLQ